MEGHRHRHRHREREKETERDRDRETNNIQTAAATTLTNLAAFNDSNKEAIAVEGGIPALIGLLEKGSPEARTQSAWALLNLSTYPPNKEMIRRAGGVRALVNCVQSGTWEGVEKAKKALHNLGVNINDDGNVHRIFFKKVRTGAQGNHTDRMGVVWFDAVTTNMGQTYMEPRGVQGAQGNPRRAKREPKRRPKATSWARWPKA